MEVITDKTSSETLRHQAAHYSCSSTDSINTNSCIQSSSSVVVLELIPAVHNRHPFTLTPTDNLERPMNPSMVLEKDGVPGENPPTWGEH